MHKFAQYILALLIIAGLVGMGWGWRDSLDPAAPTLTPDASGWQRPKSADPAHPDQLLGDWFQSGSDQGGDILTLGDDGAYKESVIYVDTYHEIVYPDGAKENPVKVRSESGTWQASGSAILLLPPITLMYDTRPVSHLEISPDASGPTLLAYHADGPGVYREVFDRDFAITSIDAYGVVDRDPPTWYQFYKSQGY